MFTHLCDTGRTVHLDQLHRFTQDWEADVTLRLRAGDPTAIDDYADHGRVVAAELTDLHATAAAHWIDCNRRGVDLAITATRNEDVDEINRRIQRERLTHRELRRDRYADISTGVAFVGDVVITRRNDRTLRSADGDHVKNRERWTIESIAADGSIVLAVGDRRVDVPADYVREHVQLGYATTEYGAQGITVDESITLVTDATTHRSLYVGATRGRDRNALFVVAPDQAAALDRLQVALTLDRSDTPAIRQWSQLVEKALGPHVPPRSPVVGIDQPSLGLP
jgi:ATP-dependent exoDNAse (exonuclease V) alpha subunit